MWPPKKNTFDAVNWPMFVWILHCAMATLHRWTFYGLALRLSRCQAKHSPPGKQIESQSEIEQTNNFFSFLHCRVAASQLNTLGVPELIARSRQSYEQIAIRLGNDRDYLRSIRHKVWTARFESPLFDCKKYANGLEKLYALMWERHARGEPVDHIAASK